MSPLFARVAALALAAGCAAAVALGAGPSGAGAAANCDTATAELSATELEMFALINAARAEEGVPPLKLSPALSRTAAWKSADRSAWGSTPSDPLFSHQDSLGRMPSERARDCGYPADAAENIAYGWGSVQATFDAWMASSGHRANILMSYYVTVGIGEVDDRWTTNFGIHDDSAPAPAPTATPEPPRPPAADTAPPRPSPTPTQPPSAMALKAGVAHVHYAGTSGPSTEVFRSLGASLHFVYTWDAAGERWLRYIPGAPSYINTLSRIEPGSELIISVDAAATWDYPGP